MTNPFAALGLPASPDLTDDDVHAAWRRVAAATHPDRPDGGEPEAFAAAASGYAALRTLAGRGETLANLAEHVPRSPRTGLAARIRGGRPGRVGARLLAAAAASTAAVLAVGWQPATYGIITGAVTWLAVTSRSDFA
jgi:hypothetical protein